MHVCIYVHTHAHARTQNIDYTEIISNAFNAAKLFYEIFVTNFICKY